MFKKKKAAEKEAPFDPAQLVNRCKPAEMIKALGGDVDQADENGWTCLHHAANLGMVPHIEALLDAKALTAAKTEAPSGKFKKNMSAIDIAEAVEKSGLGDRTRAIETLFLGSQAEGWGDWRTLKNTDANRKGEMAEKGLLKGGGGGRPGSAAGGGRAAVEQKAAVDAARAEGEDKARWAMRAELSGRDFRVQQAEGELAQVAPMAEAVILLPRLPCPM